MKKFRDRVIRKIDELMFEINRHSILHQPHIIKVDNFELKLKAGCDLVKLRKLYSKKKYSGTIRKPSRRGTKAKTLLQGFIDGTVTFEPKGESC